ncbi:retrotransposon protein, putative, ty1-copia subclass [Tanacetum coccineum]|uniref:Retrotransposon protein, putative, ty1-copia subclass n=1 Tax=Tanacetum coccineum TaxID=301880 RepID=A0ABQ5C000_9ASTR
MFVIERPLPTAPAADSEAQNGLTNDFAGFVRNYNMHNMGKTIGEIHALLIEYEKGLPKKAETPQVMMIKSGKIQKANKKSLKAKGKGKDKQVYIPKPKNPKPSAKESKDDTCHHCKEVGHWKMNCPVYLAELLKKKKQVGTASSSNNCHYVPSITRGVVSIHRLVENGFVKCFTDFRILVSKNNVHYFNAIPSNGIYEIDVHDLVPNVNSIYNVNTKRAKHNLDSTYLWHCRLAHISKKRIEKLQQEGLLKSIDDESFDQCVSCLSGKMTRKSFTYRPERATDLLEIIHTDVCGPLRHVSRQGASYFITFTDDYSRYGYVYLLKHKHEDYAQESATRILNMVPTKKVDKTPYELWYGKVLNLSYVKVWGCEALVKRDTPNKLQQRSVKCIFIRYPKETMSYYFYSPFENKIVVTRYAEFFEKNLITQEVSRRAIDLEEIQDEDTSPSEITSEIPMEVKGFEPPQEEVILIRRSERTHRAPNHLCLNVEAEEHSLGDLNEPTSYKVAMLDSESNKRIDSIDAEIQSMIDNMVWALVDLPPNSRLVAKGYTQLYGVDYEETFSPITDIRAIRILISITAFYDYEIWQMVVKTAFLNGYLDEDIYMVQPEGFVDPNHPRKVYKLQRSIYGLKQASRSWNKRFDEEIKKFGFDQNLDEPCVYQKASGSNVTFLILMDNSKRGHIPMQERLDLNKTQGASTPKEVKRMQNVLYSSVVGSIMYAVRCTIPDVAFAQNITSQFQQNPGELHLLLLRCWI